MLAGPARPAQTFNRRRRLAAFRTKRRFERNQARPAFRTCPSPSALLNRSMTDGTRDWEQEVENEVEQSALGETQRAKLLYQTETDFHLRIFLPACRYFAYGK